jgi:hypothetical protein
VLGTFTMNGVPAILSSQIVRPTPPAWNQQPGGNGSPGKRPAAGAHLPQGPGQGRPVSNPDLNPDWKVSDGREFSFFLRRMRDAPSCWGPNIQACANYWLRGVCRASCVRAASHSPLPSTCRAKLGQFITSTRTAFQAERHANPPETP